MFVAFARVDPLLLVVMLAALGGIISIAVFQIRRSWRKRHGHTGHRRKRMQAWINY